MRKIERDTVDKYQTMMTYRCVLKTIVRRENKIAMPSPRSRLNTRALSSVTTHTTCSLSGKHTQKTPWMKGLHGAGFWSSSMSYWDLLCWINGLVALTRSKRSVFQSLCTSLTCAKIPCRLTKIITAKTVWNTHKYTLENHFITLYPYNIYLLTEGDIGTFGSCWKRGPNFSKINRIISADTREDT